VQAFRTRRLAWPVGLSLLLARSAAAQVDAEPQVVPQGEPDPGETSGDVPAPAEPPVAPPAPMPAPPAPPTLVPDDGSFGVGPFLTASLGLGELWINNGVHQTWGQTVPFELAAGVAITPDVALFAAGYAARIVFPVSDDSKTNTLDLYAAGAGLKLRPTPLKIFFAVSISVSQLYIDHASQPDETSRWGILARGSVGRQWSPSPHSSLGLAGEVTYGRMDWGGETGFSPPNAYVAKGFSLLFSGGFGGATAEGAADVVASEAAAGYHAHDGFFLNVGVGLGKVWLTEGYIDAEISGTTALLDLSAGYAITPNLVIFGAFSESFAGSPTYDRVFLADLELRGVGPGVRYYVMPVNFFFEGAALVSRVDYHDTFPADTRYGINQTSEWRPVWRAAVGREWWIAANWGLGLACQAFYGSLPSKLPSTGESADSYKVKGLSLVLAASFN
jgi:hypothetical protein